MKSIPLTQGKFALVDDVDFERLSRFKWHCSSAGQSPRQKGEKRGLIMMHRIIMETPSNMEVDHKNGNRLDNRHVNLRNCLRIENSKNKKKHENSTSQYKGVSWHKATGKWQAQIEVGNKNKYLGVFSNQRIAARAYDDAAISFFGEFARTNETSLEVA